MSILCNLNTKGRRPYPFCHAKGQNDEIFFCCEKSYAGTIVNRATEKSLPTIA